MTTIDTNGDHHDPGGRYEERVGARPSGRLLASCAEPDEENEKSADPSRATSFQIGAGRLSDAAHRIEKANRRLARYGIEERFEYSTREYVKALEDGTGVPMVELTLNRPRIAAGDWQFTAAHEETPDGRIVDYGAARAIDMRCDQCGRNRLRGKVYTVTDSKSGETKQVGSNCLAAFLGVQPTGLWALEFDPVDEEAVEDDGELRGFDYSDSAFVVPAERLLALTLELTDDGRAYVSRDRADSEHPATADTIVKRIHEIGVERSPEREQLARDVLAWVEAQDESSDYVRNLRQVLAGGDRWVGRKHVGIAASAVSAYRRAQEREVQKAAAEAAYVPGFLAPVGERIRDVPVTVTGTYVMDGEYGPRTIVSMLDEQGRQVKWFASGDWGHLDAGATMTMTATVKDHGQWKEKDQTVVSRAKLAPLGASSA